jgi:hypothetical protein
MAGVMDFLLSALLVLGGVPAEPADPPSAVSYESPSALEQSGAAPVAPTGRESLENLPEGTAAAAGLLITLLVGLFRVRATGAPLLKVPARYRALVPGLLGVLVGVLVFLGGAPAQEALVIALYSGPTAVFAHETVAEGLFNRRRTRAKTAREG